MCCTAAKGLLFRPERLTLRGRRDEPVNVWNMLAAGMNGLNRPDRSDVEVFQLDVSDATCCFDVLTSSRTRAADRA